MNTILMTVIAFVAVGAVVANLLSPTQQPRAIRVRVEDRKRRF